MTILIPLPGNEAFTERLAKATGRPVGRLASRRFPDGESYVRLETPVEGEGVMLVCTLARPDDQVLRLIFAAAAARAAGARRVELLAPYMAYMRQDRLFHDGEAVSARVFAALLSRHFDHILTVDPHLHRIHNLTEVFDVPAAALGAAPLLAAWVKKNAPDAVVIGPDAESRQWVKAVAGLGQNPYAVLTKTRRGDKDVSVVLPDLTFARGRRPVLVDDIISSGQTMLQAASALREAGFQPPVCLAVHALFSDDAYKLLQAVSTMVVTTDTVPHPSNGIEIMPLLAGRFMHH